MIEADMQLPKGMYCADCVNYSRCSKMFGVRHTNTACDFVPSRFRAADTKERDLASGVGANAPSCIPMPRSQIAVSDNTPPAQARSASNTSQLAIAAREVVAAYEDDSLERMDDSINQLRSALQQQA